MVMSGKQKITITLVDRKGTRGCHRGHRAGDSFDFDTEREKLCPMAMRVAFPYLDVINVFRIERYAEASSGNK